MELFYTVIHRIFWSFRSTLLSLDYSFNALILTYRVTLDCLLIKIAFIYGWGCHTCWGHVWQWQWTWKFQFSPSSTWGTWHSLLFHTALPLTEEFITQQRSTALKRRMWPAGCSGYAQLTLLYPVGATHGGMRPPILINNQNNPHRHANRPIYI